MRAGGGAPASDVAGPSVTQQPRHVQHQTPQQPKQLLATPLLAKGSRGAPERGQPTASRSSDAHATPTPQFSTRPPKHDSLPGQGALNRRQGAPHATPSLFSPTPSRMPPGALVALALLEACVLPPFIVMLLCVHKVSPCPLYCTSLSRCAVKYSG